MMTGVLVGTRHHPGAADLLRGCPDGWPVELLLEPGNPHDPRAMAVRVDGFQVGYIAREPRAGGLFGSEEFAKRAETSGNRLLGELCRSTDGGLRVRIA